MTRQKDLSDLFLRLNYFDTKWYITSGIDGGVKVLPIPIEDIKPYLRSWSKITIEELYKLETDLLRNYVYDVIEQNRSIEIETLYDYLLDKHHFDHDGLIEDGFAIEAPEGMYK